MFSIADDFILLPELFISQIGWCLLALAQFMISTKHWKQFNIFMKVIEICSYFQDVNDEKPTFRSQNFVGEVFENAQVNMLFNSFERKAKKKVRHCCKRVAAILLMLSSFPLLLWLFVSKIKSHFYCLTVECWTVWFDV